MVTDLSYLRDTSGRLVIKVKTPKVNDITEAMEFSEIYTSATGDVRRSGRGYLFFFNNLTKHGPNNSPASRPLESSIWVVENYDELCDEIKNNNDFRRFGLVHKLNNKNVYITNLRTLFNLGFKDHILGKVVEPNNNCLPYIRYDVDYGELSEFYYTELERGIFAHVRTHHTLLGQQSTTGRRGKPVDKYIFPPIDVDDVIKSRGCKTLVGPNMKYNPYTGLNEYEIATTHYNTPNMVEYTIKEASILFSYWTNADLDTFISRMPPTLFNSWLWCLYPHRGSEIYNRTHDWFKRVRYVFGGYKNDNYGIEHLITLRGNPSKGPQKEVTEFVKLLEKAKNNSKYQMTLFDLIESISHDSNQTNK